MRHRLLVVHVEVHPAEPAGCDTEGVRVLARSWVGPRLVAVVGAVLITAGGVAYAIVSIDRPATVTQPAVRVTTPPTAGTSVRFAGTGTNDVDRIKIPLDPARPVDVGVGDFTIELWIKGDLADNPAAGCSAGDAAWITGHVVVDRDVYGDGDRGDFGLSLLGGRVAWGVSRDSSGATVCGSQMVLDGEWHHLAVTRAAATGRLQVWVDGQLDGEVLTSPATGDVSYRDGRPTSWPDSDPFLVVGAEKHDAGAQYPSFAGLIDDVRISTVIRYTGAFTRPAAPHPVDSHTAALYRFDEPGGTVVVDEVGASPGELRVGGPAGAPTRSPDVPFGG